MFLCLYWFPQSNSSVVVYKRCIWTTKFSTENVIRKKEVGLPLKHFSAKGIKEDQFRSNNEKLCVEKINVQVHMCVYVCACACTHACCTCAHSCWTNT